MDDKKLNIRTEFNIDKAEMYAKGNCKICYGRGYLKGQCGIFSSLNNQANQEYYCYCKCAIKNMKKYGK